MINIREDKSMNIERKISPNYTIELNIIHILTTKLKQERDYFIIGPGMEADRVTSVESTLRMCDKFSDVFSGIWCFKGTFYLHVKDDVKPHQVLSRCIANALQESFKKELGRVQEHQI